MAAKTFCPEHADCRFGAHSPTNHHWPSAQAPAAPASIGRASLRTIVGQQLLHSRVTSISMHNDLKSALQAFLSYCQSNDWAGYEPYDALNSLVFTALPFLDRKLPRLALTQALKRSPINVRSLLRIPKTQNPKAIGLFLSAFVKLADAGMETGRDYVELMIERLEALRSREVPYWCWGYNFPWQTRTVLVPRWAPNLVCTSFAATGLLDAYDLRHDKRYLDMAVSAADYILRELYWTGSGPVAGFAYPLPSVRNHVHNANFLAAALCSRVYKLTGEKKFIAPALRVARYSAGRQEVDGSWFYGGASTQRWIDNFHTGFNLSALRTIARYAETMEFDPCLRRGFDFYRSHFFREDG